MSTYHDYWLKGDTRLDVEAAMADAGIGLLPAQESAYDPIGTIYEPGPDVDEDGNPIHVPIPGWHANLRMTHPLSTMQELALSSVLIAQPRHPVRVWA